MSTQESVNHALRPLFCHHQGLLDTPESWGFHKTPSSEQGKLRHA